MPKVAYSEEERQQIRDDLIRTALELMAEQGIQHTTVEQIYKKVGISRTFFHSFFPTKEDLVIEALYYQQPKIIAYVNQLMSDPALKWHDAMSRFIYSCCKGAKSGFAIMSMDEQRMLFQRLSEESYRMFRKKQAVLFGKILECFGIEPSKKRVDLFINLCLTIILIHRSVPERLPFFVPEAAEETTKFQIDAVINHLEKWKA